MSELGRGRYDIDSVGHPASWLKMRCVVCNREFYIRKSTTGKPRKQFLTCCKLHSMQYANTTIGKRPKPREPIIIKGTWIESE